MIVNPDLSVPGHPNVFIAGDLAMQRIRKPINPSPVAPAAMQMGFHVAKVIRQEILTQVSTGNRKPFTYWDKGSMATIGKAKAIAEIHGWKFTGLIAWLLWSVIHLLFLIMFCAKLFVMINWGYTYLFQSTSAAHHRRIQACDTKVSRCDSDMIFSPAVQRVEVWLPTHSPGNQ